MPFNIQGPELIVLLIIALLVLGPGKLPEVGAALGRSIREFRKASTDIKEATSLEPAKSAPSTAETRAADASVAPRPDTRPSPPENPAVTPPGPVASAAAPVEPGPTGTTAASDTDQPAA